MQDFLYIYIQQKKCRGKEMVRDKNIHSLVSFVTIVMWGVLQHIRSPMSIICYNNPQRFNAGAFRENIQIFTHYWCV